LEWRCARQPGGYVLRSLVFLGIGLLVVGCASTIQEPTAAPPATLPIATGIPVTPQSAATRVAQSAEPTATVETLPTPTNGKELFREAGDLLKAYQPPDTDPTPLYDALARGTIGFLSVTANSDASLEGQPALGQLQEALKQIPNLPDQVKPQVVAIHTGDDQGGSRDLVVIAMQGVMGLPLVGIERLGGSYQARGPISFSPIATPDSRYFYPNQIETRDLTGDQVKELVYTMEYPGASGTTNELTVARWLDDKKELRTIFHAALINWAGESDYQFETTADASSIKLTFPWFGAFDHKLLAHPNATQAWEYDDKQDRFVRVSQTVEAAKTPRQQLNAAEYVFRNGDLNGAVELYQRVWSDASPQAEDFGESKADPKAFAKFRQAMVLGLLGRDADAKKLLGEAQKSGDALKQVANTFAKSYSGKEGALRSWITMANAGDLYQLIYESKAGNLDFPFEAREIYLPGGIVSAYLNTHADADKNPDALWRALDALGFKPVAHTAADLDGDGTNEFLVVTAEGGETPSKSHTLWFIYQRDKTWRVRALDSADNLGVVGEASPVPQGNGKALKLKLPDSFTPNQIALTWNGTTILWLDPATLIPSDSSEAWPIVGGGVLEDDF
jgi:hypothetical protein